MNLYGYNCADENPCYLPQEEFKPSSLSASDNIINVYLFTVENQNQAYVIYCEPTSKSPCEFSISREHSEVHTILNENEEYYNNSQTLQVYIDQYPSYTLNKIRFYVSSIGGSCSLSFLVEKIEPKAQREFAM